PLVEADRADEPIRDATEAESFFQRPGLRVRAVEDRHALIGDIVFRGAAGELGGQPLGLLPLVGGAQQDHRLPALFSVKSVLPSRAVFSAMMPFAASRMIWVER